jgi:hypothetical protein
MAIEKQKGKKNEKGREEASGKRERERERDSKSAKASKFFSEKNPQMGGNGGHESCSHLLLKQFTRK